MWIEAGSSHKEVARIQELISDAKIMSLGKGQQINSVLRKLRIAPRCLAMFEFVRENAAWAANIANPSPETQSALNAVYARYHATYEEGFRRGYVSQGSWLLLHDAVSD